MDKDKVKTLIELATSFEKADEIMSKEMRKNTICERRTPLIIGASPDIPAAG